MEVNVASFIFFDGIKASNSAGIILGETLSRNYQDQYFFFVLSYVGDPACRVHSSNHVKKKKKLHDNTDH